MRKAFFAPMLLILAIACGKNEAGGADGSAAGDNTLQSISLDRDKLVLAQGNTTRLTVSCVPQRADAAVEWVSDDPAIATVADGAVNPLAPGQTVIRARLEGKETSCSITVCPLPTAVDLGRGIKWATFNIGASNEKEAGYAFAWASAIPDEMNPKPRFPYIQNVEIDGQWKTLVSKYCQNSSYGLNGYTDKSLSLQGDDDAATQILGPHWRTPTKDEYAQLTDYCYWGWDASRNCVKISSRTNASNFIYLPITGKTYPVADQSRGYYWTASVQSQYPDGAYYFEIAHVNQDPNYDIHTTTASTRTAIHYIRAVRVD